MKHSILRETEAGKSIFLPLKSNFQEAQELIEAEAVIMQQLRYLACVFTID